MKHLKKPYYLKFMIIFILLVLYLFVSAISYATAVSASISDSVLRLHIVANSDSENDQSLKYKVRDALLQHMNQLCVNCQSKEEAISTVQNHLLEFKDIAQNTIFQEGFDYSVTIDVGNYYFPTKYYGDVSLPEGSYDALNIKIGQAQGHNWWCVMFPPLCFVDVSSGVVPEDSKEVLKYNLSTDEYEIITADNSNFKFKLIELVDKFSKAIQDDTSDYR